MTATTLERIGKPERLLIDGRLIVQRITWGRIDALCRGDSGTFYKLGYINGRWTCDCEARTECSHIKALQRVVTVKTK